MIRLTLKDRKLISKMYNDEASVFSIAVAVGCHIQTIYDDLKRGDTGRLDKNGRREYDPDLAQRTVQANMRRAGAKKRSGRYGRKAT